MFELGVARLHAAEMARREQRERICGGKVCGSTEASGFYGTI